MKTWQFKTYGIQQKQFYEECLEQYNSTSRNKKNMIKWNLSQGCKDSSTYVNQSVLSCWQACDRYNDIAIFTLEQTEALWTFCASCWWLLDMSTVEEQKQNY